jgi:proton-translocating NADH-quinone oxidoreductase chain L
MYRRRRGRPLRGSRSAGRGGQWIGRQGAVRVTTGRLITTRCLSRVGRWEVGRQGNVVTRSLCVWMNSERLRVKWGLLYDTLTVVMCVVVTRVSSLVHRYSIEYMGGDPHQPRFMSYLSLFTFFMLVLVTGDNRVQRFVGWEGVGLCSYLLINFWYTRIQANKAAIKAMLVNRVGDFGLALGMRVVYLEFRARDYATIFAMAPSAVEDGFRRGFLGGSEVKVLTRIGGFLFVGAVGKSAQLGLHTWLPDAMEGPTPVSALIHAATMVTAGVFLIARCSPRLEYAPTVRRVVTRFGGMTAFFAGTVGLVQNDLKRVIAYSTCSQLGYMIFACGLSAYEVGIFHLANHARFKALLFLSAGSVIHARGDDQDIRRMGGLVRILPRTYAMILIGSLALMGVPFRTGFYSKDVILEVGYGSYTWYGHVAHWLGTRAAFCTGFYSIRLLYYTFLGEAAGHRKVYEAAHDAPRRMGIPLRVLSVGSIWVGWLTKDRRIGLGSPFWGQALYTHVDGNLRIDAEFIPSSIKLIPVRFSRGGGGRARWRYGSYGNAKTVYRRKTTRFHSRYVYLSKKWFFDKVYTEWVVVPTRHQAYHTTYKGVDRGVIERRGPAGLTQALYQRGKRLGKLQSGEVYHYSLVMVLARVSLLARTRRHQLTPRVSTRSGFSVEKSFRICMRFLAYSRD